MRRYKNIPLSDEEKYVKILREITKIDYLHYSSAISFIRLARVMNNFPKFVYDLPELFYYEVIAFEDNQFKWNYDNTSLAGYFKKIEKKSGDFWKDIEEAFITKEGPIKEGSLRHLASSNGRGKKYKLSKDYEKILDLFFDKEREKYIHKIMAIEEIINNFWINDDDNTKFTEHCELKFAKIKKIIDG